MRSNAQQLDWRTAEKADIPQIQKQKGSEVIVCIYVVRHLRVALSPYQQRSERGACSKAHRGY